MRNLYGTFIIAAAAYWIIFGYIFIQPGLSLNPAHDDVVKPAAERKYTPSLGTKSATPPAEVEKKKKKTDAGQLVVPKSSPDQAKSLSPPSNKDSRPNDQSKSKLKSANAEQHHKHHHKHKNKQKEGRSSKLNPKSGIKKDLSRSPSPWPKRWASPPKQARESPSSSLPKMITPAPTKVTKKLDNQTSTKTPNTSSSSATHGRPARAPAS